MADTPRTHRLDVDSFNSWLHLLLLGLLGSSVGTIAGIQAYSEGVGPVAARPATRLILMGRRRSGMHPIWDLGHTPSHGQSKRAHRF